MFSVVKSGPYENLILDLRVSFRRCLESLLVRSDLQPFGISVKYSGLAFCPWHEHGVASIFGQFRMIQSEVQPA